jgi:hypothetical protein
VPFAVNVPEVTMLVGAEKLVDVTVRNPAAPAQKGREGNFSARACRDGCIGDVFADDAATGRHDPHARQERAGGGSPVEVRKQAFQDDFLRARNRVRQRG